MIHLIYYGEHVLVLFWKCLILLGDVWWGPDVQQKEFYNFGLIFLVKLQYTKVNYLFLFY